MRTRQEKIKHVLRVGMSTRFKKGHSGYKSMLGKKMSAESREKVRSAKLKNPTRYWLGKKRHDITGEKCHLWKGGITPENQKVRTSAKYKNWRRKVFERDGYACQKCGDSRGGNLNAHHIKSFSVFLELRFDVSNGVTLCESCHRKTDTYGRYR